MAANNLRKHFDKISEILVTLEHYGLSPYADRIARMCDLPNGLLEMSDLQSEPDDDAQEEEDTFRGRFLLDGEFAKHVTTEQDDISDEHKCFVSELAAHDFLATLEKTIVAKK